MAALFWFAAALLADQFTKYLAVTRLKDQPAIELIDGIFELRYLENRGAAFGMMQGMQAVFVIGAAVICAVIVILYMRMPAGRKYLPLKICAVLLCAGAVGNVIDRVRQNYVVDFLYFKLIDFPIFNVADCYVVIACIAFVLLILFFYQEEDLSFVRRRKKEERTED